MKNWCNQENIYNLLCCPILPRWLTRRNQIADAPSKLAFSDLNTENNLHQLGCRPVFAHRGHSKGEFKSPTTASLTNNDEDLFYTAEHGNYGDDAFFVVQSDRFFIFGVADGLDGWSDYNVASTTFSATLVKHACKNSIKLVNEVEAASCSTFPSQRTIEVQALLNSSYNALIELEGNQAYGSASACFGVFDSYTNVLSIANLGDTGAYVRTNSGLTFLSEKKMHNDYCPYQLANPPLQHRVRTVVLDSSRDALNYNFELNPGDYFIVGSDGLWDNVDVRVMRSNMDCSFYKIDPPDDLFKKQNTVNLLADNVFDEAVVNSEYHTSFQRAKNTDRRSRIADHGEMYGAKKDDITLIAVLI